MRDNFNEILTILESGGIILYPTDTVWAIGCDATDPEAVARVRQIRDLTTDEGLVTLVADLTQLNQLVDVPPRVMTLLSYHTRPLTMCYPTLKSDDLAHNLAASDGSFALRVPIDPFCNQLISAFGKPLVATIAALKNDPIPTHFGVISSDILEKMDYVVRYRQDDRTPNQPSVVAVLDETNELFFLRN